MMWVKRLIYTLSIVSMTCTALANGVIKRGLGPEPDSLDPHTAQGLAALNVVRDLYEGLMTLDASGRLQPGAAASWKVSDGGLRYVFELRPNARWSDGRVLTAGDFVRGLRHAVNPKVGAPYAGLLSVIRHAADIRRGELPITSLGVTALGSRQLQLELESPSPVLLEILSHPVSYPRSRMVEGVYNGAFRLVERMPQSSIQLAPNPHYHAAAQLQLSALHWLVTENPSSELALYRAGDLHITETIPPGRYRWLAENLPRELRISPYLGTFFLAFNLTRPPFADQPKLRQALALAIDRDTLTRVVTAAGEQPAYGLVAPGLKDYSYPQLPVDTMTQEERLSLAKVLYRQAGYSETNPLRISLRYNTSTAQRRLAAAVGAMWREYLGVVTELYNEEWKVFINNRNQKTQTQVVRGGWIADLPDALSFLEPFLSTSTLNYTGFADNRFDQFLRRAANAGNALQRQDYLVRAEARLLSQYPIVPLYYYVSRHLVKPAVRGFVDNVMDIHLSRYLSLAEQ